MVAMKVSSLADALFTSTQQRVLALLFGQPSRSFFVTQIMALAKSGRGAVQRELRRLSESGLITVRMIATQKHYQANPDSPLFDELCSIMQKTVGLAEPIRRSLESISGDVQLALIYGSVAKGRDTASSDLDLLIVSDQLSLESIFAALVPVESALDRHISPTLYTLREYDKRRKNKNPFLTRVLKGPTIALIGSIDAE